MNSWKKLGKKEARYYFTDVIYRRLDRNALVAMAFLDLAKAFDTVKIIYSTS